MHLFIPEHISPVQKNIIDIHFYILLIINLIIKYAVYRASKPKENNLI